MKKILLISLVVFSSILHSYSQWGYFDYGTFNMIMQQTINQYQAQQAAQQNVYNQIMQQTVNEYNTQMQREYENYKANTGSDISFNEWMNMKAQAYENSQKINNSYSSPSSNSYEKNTYENVCNSCTGTGTCKWCGGDGYSRSGGMGLESKDVTKKCTHCYGSGVCPICHGKK